MLTHDEVMELIVQLIIQTLPIGEDRNQLFFAAARWHGEQTRRANQ